MFFDAQAGLPANIPGDNANVTVQRTFATAGTYHYTCHIHPQTTVFPRTLSVFRSNIVTVPSSPDVTKPWPSR